MRLLDGLLATSRTGLRTWWALRTSQRRGPNALLWYQYHMDILSVCNHLIKYKFSGISGRVMLRFSGIYF